MNNNKIVIVIIDFRTVKQQNTVPSDSEGRKKIKTKQKRT